MNQISLRWLWNLFFLFTFKLTVRIVHIRHEKEIGFEEECLLEDESWNIYFHIWGDIHQDLNGDISYYFKNLKDA